MMEQIILSIKDTDARYTGGVSKDEIIQAEQALDFNFPEQYKVFLEQLGVLSMNGHEIFGLGVSGYLSVVETTLEERQFEETITEEYIVIENIGSEGIFLLLGKDGVIYEYANGSVKRIFNSLAEYLSEEII